MLWHLIDALDFPVCVNGTVLKQKSNLTFKKINRRSLSTAGASSLPYEPCVAVYMSDYMNRLDTQKALHILPAAATSPMEWNECNDIIFQHWSEADFFSDTTALYQEIITKVQQRSDFRMLIFSGDDDGVSIIFCCYCIVILQVGLWNHWVARVGAQHYQGAASCCSA